MRTIGIFAISAGLLFARSAHAAENQEKVACVAAHTRGQELRNAGDGLGALDELAKCARSTCPTIVREECVRLAADVERALSTMVVEARVAGETSTFKFKIFVDGSQLVAGDAGAFTVRPGTHVVRVEVDDPLVTPREVSVTVREGERNVKVLVDLSRRYAPNGRKDGDETDVDCGGSSAPACTKGRTCQTTGDCAEKDCSNGRCGRPLATFPSPTVNPPTEVSTPKSSARLGVGIVFLGASAAGWATFVGFAADGLGRESDLRTCAPGCDRARVDGMYRSYLVADVALGAAIVTTLIGGYLTITAIRAPKQSARATLVPSLGALTGTF